MAGKGITIGEFWKEKGIDMGTLEAIIDYFPEDSDASNSAKELMQELTDQAFEEPELEQLRAVWSDGYICNICKKGNVHWIQGGSRKFNSLKELEEGCKGSVTKIVRFE